MFHNFFSCSITILPTASSRSEFVLCSVKLWGVGKEVSFQKVMSTFILILLLTPQVKVVHVFCEVLSLAVLGKDSRSVVRCRVLKSERGLQATGNVIIKVIAVVFLYRDKIPPF